MILTGFGQPHADRKLQIARTNREKLGRCTSHTITTTAYVYDDTYIPDDLFDQIVRTPGIVGEFIYRLDLQHEQTFDRIMLLLDDVEWITDPHAFIDECETLLQTGRGGIFQPSLTLDSQFSHHHMRMGEASSPAVDSSFGRDKCFEYFCYYMTPRDLQIYQSLFTPDTKCMWGLDYIVPQTLPCTLFQHHKIRHWFKGGLMSKVRCREEMKRAMTRVM